MKGWSDKRKLIIVGACIRRKSMDPETWKYTRISHHHPEVLGQCKLADGELPIVTSYISNLSWYALTTRRIVGQYYGTKVDVKTCNVSNFKFDNFKGYGEVETEIMKIKMNGMPDAELEYETGKASMAPIYYRFILGK